MMTVLQMGRVAGISGFQVLMYIEVVFFNRHTRSEVRLPS